LSFLGREKLLNADCEPQEQAPQPGAAMKGASLLLVLVLAKLAVAWGHALQQPDVSANHCRVSAASARKPAWNAVSDRGRGTNRAVDS